MRWKSIVLGIFGFVALSAQAAFSQQLDNTFNDWSVFTLTQGGKKICYIASAPKKKTGNYSKRGEPYVLVTHINSSSDEVSVSSGYPYRGNSEVQFTIEGRTYKFFTKGEIGWAYDSTQDKAIVQAMKRGMSLTIKGTSQRGTYSIDTYSLKGISKAYSRMKLLCN